MIEDDDRDYVFLKPLYLRVRLACVQAFNAIGADGVSNKLTSAGGNKH